MLKTSVEGMPGVDQILAALEQAPPSPGLFAHASRILDSHLLPEPDRTPKASPPGPKTFLTIAMATYDEYDAAFLTVQSIRMYHPEIAGDTAILVLDNYPSGPGAAALKRLEDEVAGYRYVPYDRFTGTAVKDFLFREANSEFVLVMDSHVLFPAGALARLIEFLKTQLGSIDLFQGLLVSDRLQPYASHLRPEWNGATYGQWAFDERAADPDAPPFEIAMQGMGVFACHKDAWPGMNPRFQGFCVEEGYVHEKIRRNGGKVVCLPFLRWLHRFRRSSDAPYPNTWAERIRNYLIAYDELGLDNTPVREHFEALLGIEVARPLIETALGEIARPSYAYDALFGIDGDPEKYRTVIGSPVRRVTAPKTPWNPEIGRMLAHRSIVVEAQQQGLHKIMALEGDPVRGFAYERSDYERALAQFPETPTAVAMWLRKGGAVETVAREVTI